MATSNKEFVFNKIKYPICLKCKCLMFIKKTYINLSSHLVIKYSCKCSQQKNIDAEFYLSQLTFFYRICQDICTSCSSNKGYYYCNQCENYSCKKCLFIHREHLLFSTKINGLKQNCNKHFSHNYVCYCFDCNQKICELCYSSLFHKNHRCEKASFLFNTIYDKYIKQSNTISNSLKIKLKKLKENEAKSIINCYFKLLSIYKKCSAISLFKSNFEFLFSFNTLLSKLPNFENIPHIRNPFLFKQPEFKLLINDNPKSLRINELIALNSKRILVWLKDKEKSILKIYNLGFNSLLYEKVYIKHIAYIVKMDQNSFCVVLIENENDYCRTVYSGEIINYQKLAITKVIEPIECEEITSMTYIENNGFVILTWITLFYIDLNDMKYTALYENKESPFNLRYFSDLNKLFLLNNHKIFYYDMKEKKECLVQSVNEFDFDCKYLEIFYQKSHNKLIICGYFFENQNDENDSQTIIEICDADQLHNFKTYFFKYSGNTTFYQIKDNILWVNSTDNSFIVFNIKEEQIILIFTFAFFKNEIIDCVLAYDNYILFYSNNAIAY